MADLAEAIVALGKAAQTRKAARRELLESTAVVAAAIRKQLRRGDSVSMGPDDAQLAAELGTNSPDVIAAERSRRADSCYEVLRVYDGHGELHQVLCTDVCDDGEPVGAVLETIELSGADPRAGTSPDDPEGRYVRASEYVCKRFADHAVEVVHAFAELLGAETDDFAGSARQLTKLVVR